MDPESVVTPLLREVAAALDHWLVGAAVPYTFVGGFAVALLGRPRATGDVYAVAAVNDDRLEELAALGAAFGFIAREHDLVPFARQFRVLRLVPHADQRAGGCRSCGHSGRDGGNRALATAKRPRETVPFPPPEHITVMKALARRPRDVADIEGLLDRHPDMDLEQVREMLGELAEILEDPTLLEDFDGLVQRWRDSHS
jgi:hypothetical protein